MPTIAWEQTQFRGIHTQPAKTADGHIFAEDMQNLRIDGEGWLQLRSDVVAMDPDGDNIIGVATTPSHVFVLRENSKLYVRAADALETEIEVTDVSDLEGRISVVNFNTYVILTSEGADQGYIIDMRAGDDQYQAYPLGFDAPNADSIAASVVEEVPGGTESRLYNRFSDQQLSGNTFYHYVYTIVSLGDKEDPWYGMESNPNSDIDALIEGTLESGFSNVSGAIYAPDRDQNAGEIIINYAKSLPATHIRIYRSSPIMNERVDSVEITDAEFEAFVKSVLGSLQYRVVAEVEVSQVSGSFTFYDGMSDEDWAETGELLITTNDRMPSDVTQIHEYNELIFGAAGDRLIYSDLQNGVIVPWAFPPVNDIRVQGRVNCCAEINEVLLFGSRDGLWRLAGNTEYNFAVGQISDSGPIDGHAWAKITDALAFVGEGGLFLTDASRVVRSSETVLDDFFQDKKVRRGAVAFFKDGDVLYSVTLEDRDGKTQDYQFKREDAYWVRWSVPFMQSASIVEDNKATLVLVADGTGTLKRLDWNSTANAEADVAWFWESQFIDGPRGRLENQRKRYSQFQFTGEADNEMTLQVFKDNEVVPVAEATFRARESLIPVRVPINRIARRLRFRLSGMGPVKIQGMRVGIVL